MIPESPLSLTVYQPTITAGSWVPEGTYLFSLHDEVDAYGHVLQAVGGYWTGSVSLKADLSVAEDWLDSGLTRHVETRDDAQQTVFEGFVDSVEVTLGGFTVKRGPVTKLVNRAKLVYSSIDTTVSPPRSGPRESTPVANNTTSQGYYGIWWKALSGSGMIPAAALNLRDTYLAEWAYPATTQRLAMPGAGGATGTSVKLELRGYAAMLEYPYSSTTTGAQNLSVKLAAVLDGDPNGLFDSAQDSLAVNTMQVPAYEDKDRTGWALAKKLVESGDASAIRYALGVYANRRVTYAAVPTALAYLQYLNDPAQRVLDIGNSEVAPFNVLPNRWLLLPDFLVGRVPGATPLALDPRAIYIESVNYTAPRGLRIAGGQVDTINQKLASLGLAGIGGD